jgi:hypothetical protein
MVGRMAAFATTTAAATTTDRMNVAVAALHCYSQQDPQPRCVVPPAVAKQQPLPEKSHIYSCRVCLVD